MNRLSGEKSAYLKHSANQKIDWYPWSEEAFEKADKEDKPVFLSTGVVWCHWCYVMAKECFENKEIVKILNNDFICIKLDRDERPDIDRRYQQAVAAMGSGGGWPLSVFLTSDKKPFFGGAYFPPEDIMGRPGFKKILRAVADFYKSKRDEVNEYSGKLLNSLRLRPLQEAEIKKSLLDDAIEAIISEADLENGGFGSTLKFPMPGAMDFLLNRYFFDPKEAIAHIIRKTLDAMARGGFHDHLGGGFHRYSTDAAWLVPHFEKMSLVSAYEVTGQASYMNSANELMESCIYKLWDKDEGGFFDTDKDILGIKLKGIEDIPHPSPNSLAILVLLKLHAVTGKAIYRQYAETGLKVFAGNAKDMGVHAGYYFCALDAYLNMLKITIEALPESELTKAIFSSGYPYKAAVYGEDKDRIIPCLGNTCYEPVYFADNARNFLRGLSTQA